MKSFRSSKGAKEGEIMNREIQNYRDVVSKIFLRILDKGYFSNSLSLLGKKQAVMVFSRVKLPHEPKSRMRGKRLRRGL